MATETSPMTPNGFSGVMWWSRWFAVVTALVLIDTVATDVDVDDEETLMRDKQPTQKLLERFWLSMVEPN